MAVIALFFSGKIFAQADDDRHLIMPLGNSLTNHPGSRTALWETIAAETGFNEDDMWFVGSREQRSDIPPDNHEGVGGDVILDVAEKIDSLLIEYRPGYISLMIGTNDIAWTFKHTSPEDMRDSYSDLLDQMFHNGPSGMWIVAASIPPMDSAEYNGVDRNDFTTDFNELLKIMVEERFAAGDKLLYAEVADSLNRDNHLDEDGVHLNEEGYEIMGTQQALALIPAMLSTTGIPSISNNSLSARDVDADKFTVEFEKATDGENSDNTLSYTLYILESDSMKTVPFVEKNGIEKGSGTDVSSLTATDLIPRTEYWFNVVVENPDGRKGIYKSNSITTASSISDFSNNRTPTNDKTGVDINPEFGWEAAGGAEQYAFQLATDSTFNELITDFSAIESNSIILEESLDYRTQYYWRIRGMNDNETGPWSKTWSFTTIIQQPQAANLLEPADDSGDIISTPAFKWNKAERAIIYEIVIATDAMFAEIIKDSVLSDTTMVMKEPLADNSTFYWRVKAFNEGGESEWSEVWKFRTILEQPETVQLLKPAHESEVSPFPFLTWSTTDHAEEYILHLSREDSFDDLVFDTTFSVPDTSYKFETGLDPYTDFYWRIQASNESAQSEWSEVFSFYVHGGLSTDAESIPVEFTLQQNYPNPFNPITQIRYGIPKASKVQLEVFNTLGQNVSTLVNERKAAGWHTAVFDASGLSSGFYIYRIKAQDFVSTKKLMLIK